jgi:hypothetical protein
MKNRGADGGPFFYSFIRVWKCLAYAVLQRPVPLEEY